MLSVEELKNLIHETSISSIIGRYIPLKKSGTGQVGICPFHSDTHPSLQVSDEKKLFKCFACDVGGDAITFVQKFKQIEFIDSLKEIGELLGVQLEQKDGPKKDPRYDLGLTLLNKVVQMYFKYGQSQQFAPFNNFIKQRRLSQESISDSLLGYAPNVNILSQQLEQVKGEKGEKLRSVALELGLIRKSQKSFQNEYFDVFRDRIIFPVCNEAGQVVGLGSRAVFEYQKAKYLNSKESFLFNKKNLLYGLHLAKETIKKEKKVIIVEGHMDQLSLYQHGFKNVVAVMGVALGRWSIQLFKKWSAEVYLALDSDLAGQKAMTRINEELMHNGVLAKIINLEPCKDPDDFINIQGPKKFIERLGNSPLVLDELIRRNCPKELPDNLDRKLEILRKVFDLVSPLKESLLATERIIKVAANLGLKSDPSEIIQHYKNFLNEKFNHYKANVAFTKGQSHRPSHSLDEKIVESESFPIEAKKPYQREEEGFEQNELSRPFALERLERILLVECILHPECTYHEEFNELLEYLVEGEVKKFLRWLQDLYLEIDDTQYRPILIDALSRANISIPLKETVGSILYQYEYEPLDDEVFKKFIIDLKNKIYKESLIRRRKYLMEEQKKVDNLIENKELIKEIIKVTKEINEVAVKGTIQ